MKLSDLDYNLPDDRIALFPKQKRTESKLLCVDREAGNIEHKIFKDIASFFKSGDALVINNTKVLPARLLGVRDTGGKAEVLLLKEIEKNTWEALLKPGGRIKAGQTIDFSQNKIDLSARVLNDSLPQTGKRRLRFDGENIREKLWELGHMPLPPYINRADEASDRARYQTVFAEKEGAIAAPTAGLHFDEELLKQIATQGVKIIPITLHVSYGTFQPITAETVEEHKMFEETYEITTESASAIQNVKKSGGKVFVCGTTSVRALESAAREDGTIKTGQNKTSVFIYPPYRFKIADAIITNFHMPKSTLLAMISAFLGYEKSMNAYNVALQTNYRFASYGDAMLIY